MIIKLVTTTIPGLIMENRSQATVYDYEKDLEIHCKKNQWSRKIMTNHAALPQSLK